MKIETAVVVINCVMWLSVTAAVIVAFVLTQNWWSFCFLSVPLFSGYGVRRGKFEAENGDEIVIGGERK